MPLRGRSSLTDEHFFFVTTTVIKHLSVFYDEQCCDLLVRNIKHYQSKYKFSILAYVIMPTHFHWIVETTLPNVTISDIMRDIKKYSAWDIMEKLNNDKSEKMKIFNRPQYNRQKRQFWTHRFDDIVIRNNGMFRATVEYIHDNPVKAGLVSKPEDYGYSSARNYILDDHSVLEVDTDYLLDI